ncbi:cation-dependent mannose-6-phosphate receptor [Salarias fasciatus]|uniref:Cation-dependent mannose-6-phosphate receptor n=1 Tax=Salarias fasciatus TaxID=181472 RepID=A0A672GFR3_SALFA|nr:cation-dependent mannose-6-phosphate receptor [Salarias fasciatus]
MKMLINRRGGSYLVWTLAVQLVLYGIGAYATDNIKNCKLFSKSETEQKVLSRLEPLTNRNFSAQDADGEDHYTYVFQLCGDAGGVPGAGVVQVKKDQTPKIIGRYNSTQAIGGSDWVMLIYRNGDKYNQHCSGEMRNAFIMISCDRNTEVGELRVAMEDNEKEHDCFYLFELDSSSVCPVIESQLSAGSIILIIAMCLLAVYLIGGFLYQRLIVGAKGMEQFPNHAFWVEVGNLVADGCDFVCRSRSRDEAPAYRGVTAEPLEEDQDERDDHLLPM